MPDADPIASEDLMPVTVGLAGRPDAHVLAGVTRSLAAAGLTGDGVCIVLAHDHGAPFDSTQARVAAGCEVVGVEVARSAQDELPYHGEIGRVGTIRAVLNAAREREASVVAFIGAGADTFPADWIPRLVTPARVDGMDYVSPHYLRAPHEGAITRSIVYPVFRAMYGQRVRQPAAGEFGASARLLRHLLDQGFWDTDHADSGIDLWLATAAAAGGFRIGEAAFAQRPASRGIAPDLSVTIAQVVGALFSDLEQRDAVWQRVRGSAPVPVWGDGAGTTTEDAEIDLEWLVESFRLGYSALRDVWAWIVPPKTILYLKRLSETPLDRFHFAEDMWARIIYDFAVGYRGRTIPRDHLLGALTPLYLGWLASFLIEMRDRAPAEADARLENLCVTFEAQKPYLVSRWRLPDRFRV